MVAMGHDAPPPPLFLGHAATPISHSHPERVFDVAFSGDGRLLASGSEANEVRLWAADDDDAPPTLLGKPLEHEAEVLRVAWRQQEASSSASTLASATATGRVRLYRVAVGSPEEGAGREVDVRATAEFGHKQEGQVYALKWVGPRSGSKGGGGEQELMTAMDDKLFFWDCARGGGPTVVAKWEFQHLPGSDSFGGAARNPDCTSYIFDAAVGGLNQGGSPVVCLALSDGSVRIHDRRTAQAVATLRRSASSHLTSLCLATEEGVLVACGGRGEATVYDTRTFSVRNVLQGHARPCFGAQVVPRAIVRRHYQALSRTAGAGAGAGADPETPPLLLMTWSSDSTLALHDLSSPPTVPTSLDPLRPVARTPHANFPIFCAAFGPAMPESDRPVRLVLGGGEGQQEQHQHQHGHSHGHSHGEGEGGSCSGHDHHHGKGEKDENKGPGTLLSYSFA